MRAVADHLTPCQFEQASRVGGGVGEQGCEWLSSALEQPLHPSSSELHIDSIGGDTHEDVGAEAGTEFAVPGLESLAGDGSEVLRERGDLELVVLLEVVRLGQDSPQVRLRHEVVRAVHPQERIAEELADLVDVVRRSLNEQLGVIRQTCAVAVTDRHVLSADRRAIGCHPGEPGLRDRARYAAPQDGVGESSLGQDLGHLGDVAEHVREVANLHHATERGTTHDAHLQVPDHGLGRHQELVHKDVPRTHGEASRGGEGTNALFCFGSHLQVVVDHGHLAVEEEPAVARVTLHEGEELVE